MIAEEERLLKIIERQEDMLGNAGLGRAHTATLHVSPDGTGADGLSWRTAYQTINAALDAASTAANALTLILIAPHPTYYDINLTGTPEWTANVALQGSHRDIVEIRNTHGAAGLIFELSGKSIISDICFHLHTDGNGLIMSGDGARVDRCLFDGTLQEDAAIALWMRGDRQRVRDCDFHGAKLWTIGIKLDASADSHLERLHITDCERGIWLGDVASDHNTFHHIDIHDCALGIDIDSGNVQHFESIAFLGNTRNVDDEVGDSEWIDIHGEFDIAISPDDLVGVTVNTGAAGVYGGDTEILAAAGRDNPFRIVGVNFDPSAVAEWYSVRFSHDAAGSFYDVLMFVGVKREGIAAPSGTEHIFNAGTRISCSARDETGGDTVQVWVEIQEI